MQTYLLVAMMLYSTFGIALSAPTKAAAMESSSKAGTLDYSSCEKPIWPKRALEDKKTGAVRLALLIGVDGKVMQSKLLKSSGFSDWMMLLETEYQSFVFSGPDEWPSHTGMAII